MSYSFRRAEHRKALDIAGSALSASHRTRRLQRCHALLRQLDPSKPPVTAPPREFQWQCRALRERVHLYSERLAEIDDPDAVQDQTLNKTEWAIALSLNYFQNVLAPPEDSDDKPDGSGDDA